MFTTETFEKFRTNLDITNSGYYDDVKSDEFTDAVKFCTEYENKPGFMDAYKHYLKHEAKDLSYEETLF